MFYGKACGISPERIIKDKWKHASAMIVGICPNLAGRKGEILLHNAQILEKLKRGNNSNHF